MTGQFKQRTSIEDFADDERFTRYEAAQLLGVHPRTLDHWIRERRIGHVRQVGRVFITGAHLQEFWANNQRAPWQPDLPFDEVAS